MVMRLDIALSLKYWLTRNKSQACIRDGLVFVDGVTVTKPSFEIAKNELIILREDKKIHWVSRSAGKLDGFLSQLRATNSELRISGTNCLDVGSSTGGFTQILLELWAEHVDAVDVGTDQLHTSIRTDPRVSVYEQTDIRDFAYRYSRSGTQGNPPQHSNILTLHPSNKYDIIVCDASFISLGTIFPSILKLADTHTAMILLWKPQFEVGRVHLRRTWVPKDEKIVLRKQKEWEDFVIANNCEILQKEKSTVIGEAGNQEWLYLIKKS